MRYTRIFATPDGESHVVDADLGPGHGEDSATVLMNTAASETIIVRLMPNCQQDWHCSPVPTMCVVLSGEALFTVSDGETRRFGPAEIVVTEDTDGKGHVTGASETGTVLLVIRLA